MLDACAMIGEYVLGTRIFEGTCPVRASQESAASLEVGVEGPPARSHRGEHFPEIRFRGPPIRFATKVTTRLLWDVTGIFTCVVNFVEKSYFPEILDAMIFFESRLSKNYVEARNPTPESLVRECPSTWSLPPTMSLRSCLGYPVRCTLGYPVRCALV